MATNRIRGKDDEMGVRTKSWTKMVRLGACDAELQPRAEEEGTRVPRRVRRQGDQGDTQPWLPHEADDAPVGRREGRGPRPHGGDALQPPRPLGDGQGRVVVRGGMDGRSVARILGMPDAATACSWVRPAERRESPVRRHA